ncbi:MAG TPA: hypothetical protein DCY00_06030 [Actinobacteria bacterium]|nr:hypothetical protein [Actinomycetota bacterium]
MIEKELIINNSKYKTAHEIKNLCILSLIDSYSRVKNMQNIISINENKIRDKFVSDMNNNCKLIRSELNNNTIRIIPESWDPDKRRKPDIVFFIAGIGDFTFECKKLSSDEDKYLNDGLIRFISLAYAEKESEAGMIGFTLDVGIPQKLKDKIKQFHCSKFIDKPVLDFPDSYKSIHTCENSKEIVIFHLFFYFSKN